MVDLARIARRGWRTIARSLVGHFVHPRLADEPLARERSVTTSGKLKRLQKTNVPLKMGLREGIGIVFSYESAGDAYGGAVVETFCAVLR